MLFPLSKSMSSTRFFQSGGAHSESVPRRRWDCSTVGAEERMYEVHKLLTEKKPFSEHMRMAQTRSEALLRKDAEFGRAHKESIQEMTRRVDEQSRANQQEWKQGLKDARLRKTQGAADIAAQMKDQTLEYQGVRADMEVRVRAMPCLCGDPPGREGAERTQRREDGFRAVKDGTKAYFQERKALQQKLSERRSMSTGSLRRDPESVIEEQKAAKFAQLSKTRRDYEGKLEELYDKHHQRVHAERQKRKEDFQAHLDFKNSAQDAMAEQRAAHQQKVKEEQEGREDRLRNRPKGFAGYSPKAKSDRRVREEAVLADLAGGNATRRPGAALG